MKVLKIDAASKQARTIIANKGRYQTVERLTHVPWPVIGCLHMRESDGSFSTWLHNGDPMRRNGQPVQTVHVPAHRPPNPNCTWEDGAADALEYEHLTGFTDWCPELVAYILERFNGWGYRNPQRNIPSPYLWGGTSVQKRGKFVRDGVYDSGTMDTQIGGMAVLRQLMDLDPDARSAFEPLPTSNPLTPAPPKLESASPPLVAAPKAQDTETNMKPLTHSKTIWGGIVGAASSAVGALTGFFDKLNNPYTLTAFLVLLAAGGIGLYLVVKGRIDVQAVVAHLSDDDTTEAGK